MKEIPGLGHGPDDRRLPPALVAEEPELDFSVLITCYEEEAGIDEFHKRLASTLTGLGRSFEILYVNDGSSDGTWDRLRAIFEADRDVSAIVDLFGNTGQANATTPGLLLARGRAIVLLDCDLQLDPEELPRLVERYDAGHEIVTGYRQERHDSLRRRLPSIIANAIMRRASNTRLRDFGCTFKIYDGALVRAFEFGPFKPWRPLPVIAAARRIAEVPVSHHTRPHGESGWTFRKLFEYNMENIVNLSERIFQVLGGLCFFFAAVFTLRIASSFVYDTSILTVTPGLILNLVVVGLLVTTAILSILGEFVLRSFVVLQRKPAFIVRELLRRGRDGR